jgi:hypothetical protein
VTPEFRPARGAGRAGAARYGCAQRFIHASTVSYHWMLSPGFNTQ